MPNNGNDVYADVNSTNVAVKPIINHFFFNLLTNVHRRLNTKQSYFNPWAFTFKLTLHNTIFLTIFNVLSKFTDSSNRLYVHTESVKDSKGNTKELVISFHQLAPLEYHFGKLIGSDFYVGDFFFKDVNRNLVNVVCRPDKLFQLKYNVKKHSCIVSGFFKVENEYGCVLST